VIRLAVNAATPYHRARAGATMARAPCVGMNRFRVYCMLNRSEYSAARAGNQLKTPIDIVSLTFPLHCFATGLNACRYSYSAASSVSSSVPIDFHGIGGRIWWPVE